LECIATICSYRQGREEAEFKALEKNKKSGESSEKENSGSRKETEEVKALKVEGDQKKSQRFKYRPCIKRSCKKRPHLERVRGKKN